MGPARVTERIDGLNAQLRGDGQDAARGELHAGVDQAELGHGLLRCEGI
jgi:hypothetical protein